MIYRKVDENGLWIEDVNFDFPPVIYDEEMNIIPNPQYRAEDVPSGFVLPKWNGTDWVEGGVKPAETIHLKTIEEEVVEIQATQTKVVDALLGIMGVTL